MESIDEVPDPEEVTLDLSEDAGPSELPDTSDNDAEEDEEESKAGKALV